MTQPTADDVRTARSGELDAPALYAILRLRQQVFVLEQQSLYPDIDGRDLEPGTRHLWIEDAGEPVAYLRVLDEPEALVIGRVVTAPAARGRGLAARLVRVVLDSRGGRDVVLDAQAYLVPWYERLGFVRAGDDHDDAGVLHTPMRYAGAQSPDFLNVLTSNATEKAGESMESTRSNENRS